MIEQTIIDDAIKCHVNCTEQSGALHNLSEFVKLQRARWDIERQRSNGEPWYGHKFKEVQKGKWECECGRVIVSAPQHSPIQGWQLVPIEPTDEMYAEGQKKEVCGYSCMAIYDAMLSAAPSAPIEAQQSVTQALKAAAKIAENGCLVEPDGGSPTENEIAMCNLIAKQIRALIPSTQAPKEVVK